MTEISYREYWAEIESICTSTLEECREHQRIPHEQLWETIDGHEWVIYTHSNFDVMKHSKNDGYSAENFGVESITQDGALKTEAIAFGCLYGDCIENADFDWNEIPEQEATTDA